MASSIKSLFLVGVFGVVGIVGALGIIRPTRIMESLWFQPPDEPQVITDEQRDFTDRQVRSNPERATPANGGVSSLGEEEGPTSTRKEIERLKASLDELSQLLQEKNTLEFEVSRLRHLLEGKTGVLPETSAGKRHEFETTITTQEKEIKRLQANLEKQNLLLREKTTKLSSAENAVEQQNAEKEKTIARLESKVAHLNHMLEQKTTALSSAEEVATKWDHELTVTNERQHEEIKTAHRTSTDYQQMNTLLSPSIVNKADSISVAEVADLVRVLNAQIEQLSSLFADSLSAQESTNTGKELDIVWDELNDYIGPWLCNNLKRRSKELIAEPDSLIIQITLQTGLVNACSRIINNWDSPFWIDGLVFSHGQVTADAQSERQEANKRYLTGMLLKLIPAVGGSQESGRTLLSQYNEKMEDIVQKAIELHKTVNEDVTSTELVTYTSPSDTSFDASQMEDMEGDGNKSQSGTVVCTVEMGLRCRKRDRTGKQNGSRDEWGVTVKSRVVLAATLDT